MSAENRLIEKCQAGDADAWDELFSLHYPAVGRFVFQISPAFSREDVEEISQEVFLSVIKHLGSFQGGSQLQTWIFRIALNKARDFIERQNAAKRGGGQTPVSLHVEEPEQGRPIDPPDSTLTPDAQMIRAEQMQFVRQALDELGDPCREIIQLRYFGDLSYEEISYTLKLNEKTVSSRLSKCLDRLEIVARSLLAPDADAAPGEKSRPFSV